MSKRNYVLVYGYYEDVLTMVETEDEAKCVLENCQGNINGDEVKIMTYEEWVNDGFKICGYEGYWKIVDEFDYCGDKYLLAQSIGHYDFDIILDENKEIVVENVYGGFMELYMDI